MNEDNFLEIVQVPIKIGYRKIDTCANCTFKEIPDICSKLICREWYIYGFIKKIERYEKLSF